MPRACRAEMSYDPRRKLYYKKIKDPITAKWLPVYGHTKAEVRAKLRQREEDLAQEAAQVADPLVFVYAKQWYDLHTGEYTEKRKEDYRNAINNYICPVIGAKQLREVTYSDIMEIMAAAPPSKSAQQKIATALRRIFKAAARDHIIKESPCADLKAGGQDAPEKVALTKAQQGTLLEAVRGCAIYPFVALCLYAGLRREEALGLLWDNVHLEQPAPHVDVRTACNWDGKNTARLATELKSSAAYRTIPIPPQLVEILTAEQESNPGSYVISRDAGELLTAAAFRRRWDAVKLRETHTICRTVRGVKQEKELKVGDPVPYHPGVVVSMDYHVTPHLLRHTYISELILAGVSVKRVQYLAGHSSPLTTLKIYTHLMDNKPEDLIGEIMRAFA